MFLGYCFDKDGRYCPPVSLETVEEVFSYVALQKNLFPEIRITDLDDYVVLHVKNGKIIYPESPTNV